jgi:prepilin-type N-terminal cleavage/methylation domain-containing protein
MKRMDTERSPSPQRWQTQRGFSLPELLVSMALLGIIAGIGFYTVNTGNWRSSSAAADIAHRLEYARSRAVLEGHDYVVLFHPEDNTFQMLNDKNSDGDYDPGIGETIATYSISAAGSGVQFGFLASIDDIQGNTMATALELPGSPAAVTFSRLGSSSAGTIYLIPIEDLANSYPGHMRAISVSGATARVRRWEYNAGSATPGPWRLER